MRSVLALLFLTTPLLLTSCLPGSQRQQTRGITAADSLSREIAAAMPVDSLALVRRITPPDSPELEYPMTLAFSADGSALHVLDQEDSHLSTFDVRTGERTRIVTPDDFAYPLLAGQRGDTLAVLSREDARLHFVHEGQVIRTLQLPDASYATVLVTDTSIVLKSVDQNAGTDDEEAGTFVALLADNDGRSEVTEQARYDLRAAWWRHLGYVRPWGDAVVSLSGYRPVVDVWTPDTPDGASLDTLALVGFDSPLLNTSLRFMRDEVREPPLLTASARALDDTLYVLNLRPGTIRIDAYTREDHQARLQRVYEYQAVPDQQDPLALFPTDLDVRREADGALTFAVLVKEPDVGVLLLRQRANSAE